MTRHAPPAAPEASVFARRLAQRLLRPLERFLRIEASSGIVLLVAAAGALLWANSPWGASYERFWETPITLGVGRFVDVRPLHFWINDGLMTIFFFVVGLEIRREIHEGELADLRRAVLPIMAACGGMIAPALIYFSIHHEGAARSGWGVPTATDIAFAVGVLALVGKRVPPALRVLLLALAIIDDIGAIVIIAFFYSEGISIAGLGVAAAGLLGIWLFQRLGVRRALAYLPPAAIVWLGMLEAHVHPTIAGVLIGLLTPVRPWFGIDGFLAAAGDAIEDFRERRDRGGHALLQPLRRIRQAQREALPPVVKLQAELHPWVAYGIMPLFALANAGVDVRALGHVDGEATSVALSVLVALVVGKPLGIMALTAASVRLRICTLPRGVGWRGILLVGCVAGIGFTMAIFIAGLAFEDEALLGAAKLGVLVGSAIAAVAGVTLGRLMLSPTPAPGAALTVEQAEASASE